MHPRTPSPSFLQRWLPFALALVALSACAGNPPASDSGRRDAMQQRLAEADRNGDGLLSREEAAALPRLAERFDSIDSNGDGLISREELAAMARANGRGRGR
jgi:Ca2+-binding EF-hand superfamily protein